MGFLSRLRSQRPAAEETAPRPEKNPVRRLLSYETAYLQCLGKRERQEDAFSFVNESDVTQIKENGLLAVVADGMGGMSGGQEASNLAVNTLCEDFRRMDRGDDLAQQLTDSVGRACALVHQRLDGGGGSTLIACLLYRQRLFFASVGDSYLFLLRKGCLIRLNREHNVKHKLFMEAIRSGSVDPSVADGNKENAALTQFLGMPSLDDVDFLRKPLLLQKGDVLLLCSDGVGGVVDEKAITDCIGIHHAPAVCAALDQAVRRANKKYQDNYTALVIRCDK